MKNIENINIKELKNLPGPLYYLIKNYQQEESIFKKLHRLLDCFEWGN